VPKGQARIRVQISTLHSQDDLLTCVHAFTRVGRKLGIVA
jgi:glycine C-acetyltransferase